MSVSFPLVESRHSKVFQKLLTEQRERLVLAMADAIEAARRGESGADLLSGDAQANTLAGIHALNTMIVVDEVGDVPSGVVAAADASLATQGTGKPEVHKILIAKNVLRHYESGASWDFAS